MACRRTQFSRHRMDWSSWFWLLLFRGREQQHKHDKPSSFIHWWMGKSSQNDRIIEREQRSILSKVFGIEKYCKPKNARGVFLCQAPSHVVPLKSKTSSSLSGASGSGSSSQLFRRSETKVRKFGINSLSMNDHLAHFQPSSSTSQSGGVGLAKLASIHKTTAKSRTEKSGKCRSLRFSLFWLILLFAVEPKKAKMIEALPPRKT